ncbi:fasciclin domain-containing protein [Muricauda oceani]|uniref:Fasciclin domain-containing protein n=1 Tax=Flagellimonas oceani TaxID=2698672 RepID=A0A6G7J277_9FLAO|nr:fasciclin domain-containing protein [Allomuricauda oceani]MBW8241280.1 fasciclin domain-containing protein [Allomuricauda oceani]QII44719.1 fasciclin domain-containing protein [Allomuricauda oceani]
MNTPATKFLLGICLSLSLCTVAQNTDKSISYTGKMDNHKILLAAVNATELGALLQKSGPFTIFAPSDAAFEKFSNNKMSDLINAKDKSALKSLVSYHIVAGQLTASRMLRAIGRGNGIASFTTVQGKKLTAHLDGYDIVLTDPVGNMARITTADLNLDMENEDVVHEIDRVILPAQM